MRQVAANNISNLDRIDVLSSMSFSASLAAIFPALISGASLHILPEHANIEDIPNFLDNEEITLSTMVPTLFRSLMQLPFDYTSLKLRFICLGGEKVTWNDVLLYQARFGPTVTFQAALASSECRTIAQCLYLGHACIPVEPRLIYQPITGKKIRIVNDLGAEINNGKCGKIAVESAIIGHRYASKHTGFKRHQNGFVSFVTDDRASMNADGTLVLNDSSNRNIKLKGVFVNLDALETKLKFALEASEIFVHGNAQNTGIDIHLAGLVPTQSTYQTAFTLLNGLAFNIHNYPNELPKLASGKTDREALKQKSEHGSITAMLASNNKVYDVFRMIFPTVENFTNRHFFNDLGGDSIKAVEAAVLLSKAFNHTLASNIIHSFPRFDDLCNRVMLKEELVLKQLVHTSNEAENVLLFAWISGGYGSYQDLINAFEGRYNVYVLIYPYIENKSFLSLEALAERCAAFLDTKNVRFLFAAGHSFTGLLAYHTAAKQASIEGLVLFDTPTYRRIKLLKRRALAVKRVSSILGRSLKSKKHFDKEWSKLKMAVNVRFLKNNSAVNVPNEQRNINYFGFFEHCFKTEVTNPSTHFRMGIFTAKQQNSFVYEIEADFTWERFNDCVVFRQELEGNHATMLAKENCEEMVGVIKQHFSTNLKFVDQEIPLMNVSS